MESSGSTKILDFRYDQSGAPYSLTYTVGSTSTVYYYVTNLQGDVMYLVDSSGNQVAAYLYDPFGKVLSSSGTMAEINPLRYRGYYQDSETGFYYLQSRYYDPAICRFINADSYASTGQGLVGYNAFAYCGNSPINKVDSSGAFWEIIVGAAVGGMIAGALIGTISHLVSCGMSGSDVTVSDVLKAAASGAVTGAIGAVAGVLGGGYAAAGAGLVGVITGTITAKNTEGPLGKKIVTGLAAGVLSALGTYIGSKIPVAIDDAFSTAVTSFAGGLLSGVQTEIASVAAQQTVSAAFKAPVKHGLPALGVSSGRNKKIFAISIYE